MQPFPIKNNFPIGFYEEFASFIIAFGRLDYLIKLCLKDLIANGFTKGMVDAESTKQFSALCDKVKKLACKNQELSQIKIDILFKLIDQAKKIADFRNNIVHGLWTTDSNGQPFLIRPKWNNNLKSVDWYSGVVLLIDIENNRKKIEDLYQELDTVRRKW